MNDQATRPSLPIGMMIESGASIIDLIDRQLFTEVYALSDGTFLHLFLDIELQEALAKKSSVAIATSRGVLRAVIYPDYSPYSLVKRIADMKGQRGLNAVAGMRALKDVLDRDVVRPLLHREKYDAYKLLQNFHRPEPPNFHNGSHLIS